MNERYFLSRRINNLMHAALLLGGMTALAVLVGWALAGAGGSIVGVLFGIGLVLFGPRLSPALVLRMYDARPVQEPDLPGLFAILGELAGRAELPAPPRVFYVPSRMMNAFSVGGGREAVIAVTDGLLRNLGPRELVGVLAHEISHIRHNDMWIMSLADSVSRLVRLLAFAGLFLLLMNLPLLVAGGHGVSWLLVLLLILAPTLSALLQMALSRNREFDADLEAVQLTGDPQGLAAALQRLELVQGWLWERMLLPGRRVPEPSLLRTHPSTAERVRRILELARSSPVPEVHGAAAPLLPPRWPEVTTSPARRWHGLWF